MNWIEENGNKSDGAHYDIYLTGSETAKNQEQFVAKVCFPISK